MKDNDTKNNDLDTEIKRLQQKISLLETRENEQRIKMKRIETIVSTLSGFLWEVDSEGYYTYCSQDIENLMGYSPDEMAGKNFIDFISKNETGHVLKIIERLFSQKRHSPNRVINFSRRIRKKDNSERVFLTNAIPIINEKDTLIGYFGIDKDITQQTYIEEMLRVSEERYHTFIDSIDDSVYLKDEQLRYILVNNTFCSYFDKSPEEVVGRTVYDLLPKHLADTYSELDRKVLSTKSLVITEFEINGRIFETRKFPVRLHKDFAIGGVDRDITKQRMMEASLSDEKKKFAKVVENAPVGIMLIGSDGLIKYVNPKFTKIFGYDVKDVPDGKTWFRKAYPDSSYRHEVIATWKKDASDNSLGIKEPWVLTVTCKDSKQKTVNFIPVKLDSGEFVITCEDMTELKNNEKRLLFLSTCDQLTGLPNRISMEKDVQQAIEIAKVGKKRGNLSALLIFDVEDFTMFNNAYGHISGDEVLISIAKTVKNILRTNDSAYRFGNDEFAVLFRGISLAEAKLGAERIQRTINNNFFTFDYLKHHIRLSMGIIQIDGSMDVISLISKTVYTVYKAKRLGQNKILIYDELLEKL